ncbi:MAG: aminopeptidase [Clostridia bacterium]|nr:aminopeptidase [Clostridia bacterium]
MNVRQLKRYAKLIAKTGLNIKKGQTVFIAAGLDQPKFVEYVVEECYKAGAKEVFVEWSHQPIAKLNYKYRTKETLCEFRSFEKAK